MAARRREPLAAPFFARDTVRVARGLLGCILEAVVDDEVTCGRIVEVEAYVGPHDPADHGYANRRTRRNDALFGPPGTAYVYFTYGMHWCFNAVTERDGYPAAVLIRALQPLSGMNVMARRRGTDREISFCSGPARLCQALGITGEHNGRALADGPVRILRDRAQPVRSIAAGPRIGISRAPDWPLRFWERGSRWLSRPEK